MASRLLDSLRREMRLRGYSLRTEKSYCYWVRCYIRYNANRHPAHLGTREVTDFLSYLACKKHVAINTQKVALNALVFLYHQLLKQDLGELGF